MRETPRIQNPFIYISVITISSVLLIILNVLIEMVIPFSPIFLAAYIGFVLIFVIWHAVLTKGWKRTFFMLALSFILAFIAEALGVNFGLIFGHYHYTSILGPQLFGVPFLAALAWEPIIYASFCITDILAPSFFDNSNSLFTRLTSYIGLSLVGALATTAWDMMIDPIAVSNGWWVWEGGGSYLPYVANGVPITNFLGWLGVSFTINLLYRFFNPASRNQIPSLTISIYGPLMLYSSLFLTALGVSITILRRPEVALVGIFAMGPFILISLANLNLFKQGLPAFIASVWMDLKAPK